MHRCWLGEIAPLTIGAEVTLSSEESAHVARVLRMKTGDRVQLIAAERLYDGELSSVSDDGATARVLAELPSPEASVKVTLVQGLPKSDKLELIVQKATELGVWSILPVEMERSIAKIDKKDDRKRERLSRIAMEAAKQSGRAHVPEILPSSTWKSALEALRDQTIFIAWEEEGEQKLSEAVRHWQSSGAQGELALVIGPEGGITPREVENLQQLGAQCVTLGKRILRTETAGFTAIAVTMSTLGEL